jgi:hypothetical protein
MIDLTHLFPGISPHGPEVPQSVWNLPYDVWVAYAAAVDNWRDELRKGVS